MAGRTAKKHPPGMAVAVHFLRMHKIFYPEDPNLCVGWSSKPIMLSQEAYPAQPLWAVPHTHVGDPDAKRVPVVMLRGRLVEAWRIEWYRSTGYMPRAWEDVRIICPTDHCLNFDHMELVRANKDRSLIREVLAHMSPPDEYGHRMWNGPVTKGDTPYPYIYFQGRTIGIRTMLYRAVVGARSRPKFEGEDYEFTRDVVEGGSVFLPVAPGRFVAMECGQSLCLEPSHMGVRKRDTRLNRGKFGPGGTDRPLSTHCKNGHEYAGDNVYVNSRGTRVCRTCQRERVQRYRGNTLPHIREDEVPSELSQGKGLWREAGSDSHVEDALVYEQVQTNGHDDLEDWLKELSDLVEEDE